MATRVYLAGPLAIESGDVVIRSADFGGHQSRLLFALLVCADGRVVSKAELADALWPGDLPPSWEVSLAALVSKQRHLLARTAIGRDAVDGALGAYRLALPEDTWVDVLAVGANIYQAEGALLRGAPDEAAPHALVAAAITRRRFLPEDEGGWIDRMREQLSLQRVRTLEILAECLLARGDHARAIAAAMEILELDALDETAYQLLMRAHAGGGNRAEALKVYERLRRSLRGELGVDPSPASEAVYLEILRA